MFEIHQIWIRLLASAAFLVFLAFFLNSCALGIYNIGNFAGIFACLLGLFYFAANPIAAGIMQKIWETVFGRIFLSGCIGIIGLSAVLAVVISGFMLHSMYDTPKEENVVVILGCKVKNGAPSLMLKRRLDAAYDYLSEHPEVPVIVCGGQGPDEAISEAQCMYEYLTAKGIAPDRIYQDDQSTSTYENLRNAKAFLEDNQLGDTITIVTDGYHQLRASMVADSLALQSDHISAETSWYLIPTYWVREWLGVCYQVVFG